MPEVEDKVDMVQMPNFQQPSQIMNVKLWEAEGP